MSLLFWRDLFLVDLAGRSSCLASNKIVCVRKLPLWLVIPLAMICGSGVAIQSQINGQLGLRLHDGATAAAISFGSGLVLLFLALLCAPSGRKGLGKLRHAISSREISWWYACGGAAGAFFVFSQGVAAAVLGVALFTVAVVAGQTLSGLFFDRIGLGPGGARPLTSPRIVGAVIAVAAVVWAVSAELAGPISGWLLLLPLVAGFGQGWQQAVNGQVRVRAESVLAATFVNFLVGTVVLVLMMLANWALHGLPRPLPALPWLYLGGLIGCFFIAGSTFLVRYTGVLLLGLALLAGQLVAALVIGMVTPGASHAVSVSTVGGAVLSFVAVVIVGVRWPRRSRSLTSEN